MASGPSPEQKAKRIWRNFKQRFYFAMRDLEREFDTPLKISLPWKKTNNLRVEHLT